ncbi:MAG TPA: hypothetical protein VGG75_35700, partial [Trebonia sp.]
GELGWHAVTPSRALAAAVADAYGGTVRHGKGGWQARVPHAALTATAVHADAGALWCRLGNGADAGTFAVAFAPWRPDAVLKCPPAELPAPGRLAVHAVLLTTRMGQIIRYLAPEFTAT